jgi:murein DD-endopeptidase MepM/ murein hydrolase activator NlpD
MARRMRLRLLLAVVTVPLALWAALPMTSSGAPSRAQLEALDKRMDAKRRAIERRRGHERVLASDIAAYSRRISSLQEDITGLQRREVRLQADLDAQLAELARVQERLRQERLRLARLRARLAEARRALSLRLVELYKSDKPDVVTVILEADGFADLLRRTEFMQRVSDQDARIIARVKRARREAKATEKRLRRLEVRERAVARVIEGRRDEVATVRVSLVDRRDAFAGARADKSAALATTREHRHDLEGDLAELQAASSRVEAALQAASARAAGAGTLTAGPARQGSGSLVWPVNGPIVSPFGPRWGRLHAGVDIAAPTGTPIRASDSGTVVLLGWVGGYGNYTCVAHGSGGLSTCYAHQSRYATSQGASVAKGQVIGYVGCTGHCFGDHLHFETRINGVPVNPAGYL